MFKTKLEAEKLSEASSLGRASWRLISPLVYVRPNGEEIIAPAGFVTDFASVPRMFYMLAGDTAHASATIHDILVTWHWRWDLAADVFNEAMRDEGVPTWRRLLMYAAVKWFGNPNAYRGDDGYRNG